MQPVSASSGITASFGYDAAGSQVRYTDGNGGNWYDTCNSWGLRQSRVEPATSRYTSAADSAFTTSYDADGNAVEVAEPGGVTVASAYNSVGELTGQSGSGADAATASRSFGYDAAGDLTSASTGAAGGSAATGESFTYDDRGLVLAASGTAGPSSYAYNGDGQVASVADAAGTTSYTYDSTGRLATLADPLTGTTLSYSYTPDSQVSGISYGGGGDTRTLAYDSLHRLTSDTLATSSGATVASVSYGYSAGGLVTSQATTGLAGPSSSTYAYDEAGRLTSWDNGTSTTAYQWDANGNLTQKGGVTYSYDARDELTSDGTSSYACTARGTAVTEPGAAGAGSIAVTSDAYGQQAAAGAGSYTYDALGRLTGEVPSSGSAAQFSYAGKSGSVASDGSSAYSWTPSGSSLVASGAPGGGGGVLALADVHGNVVGQFTAAGSGLSGSAAYGPWGTVTAVSGAQTGSLGYQSAWADPATGKDLMGARWYNPAAGGFTSADTIPQSPLPASGAGNPFAYAGGNPLENTDPTGHAMLHMTDGNPGDVAEYVFAGVLSEDTRPAGHARQSALAYAAYDAVIRRGRAQAAALREEAARSGNRQAKPGTSLKPKDRPSPPASSALVAITPNVVVQKSDPYYQPMIKAYNAYIADYCPSAPSQCARMARGDIGQQMWFWGQACHTPQAQGTCDPQFVAALATPDIFSPARSDQAYVISSDVTDGYAVGSLITCGAGESFTASTRVLLAGGKTVPISTLRPGDKVLAKDTKTGKDQAEAVTAVLVRHDTDLYNLTVKTKAGTQVIRTTSNHLFWVPGQRQWVTAGKLKEGEHLQTPDGTPAVADGGTTPKDHDGWMWDLTVPGNNDHDFYVLPAQARNSHHTYHVVAGGTPILVHNTNGACDLPLHENAGGHAIARHVGRTDAQLAARNIRYSSTFNDLASAETATSDNIAANQGDIARWLAGTDRRLVITNPMDSAGGRVLERSTGNILSPSSVRTVLERNSSMPDGYLIITSYPEP